jgi:hypothetical protein
MGKHICSDCNEEFNSEIELSKHTTTDIICKKYKHIVFTCTICDINMIGLRNIKKHINICQEKPGKSHKKQISCETCHSLQEKIDRLSKELTIEKVKSRLFSNLLEINTNIKVDSVFIQNPSSIDIHSGINENIPVILHEEGIDYQLADNGKKIKRRNYRPIGNTKIDKIMADTRQLSDTEKEEPGTIKEKPKKEIVTDINTETSLIFEELFKSLNEQAKIYNKTLLSFKKHRYKLVNTMTYECYMKLLVEHVNKIREIIQKKPQVLSKDKLQKHILTSLAPFETRMLMEEKYYSSELDFDDIKSITNLISNTVDINISNTKFDQNNIMHAINTYGLATISLIDLLTIIFKPLWNNILIYLPLETSKKEDPYSFYRLDKILANNRKRWNMDCRFESLAETIRIHVLPYAIKLFRTIYSDIFSHNDYITNYKIHSEIFEKETEQLLVNIIIVGSPIKLSKLLRKITMLHSTYIPTDSDFFNLKTDDAMCKDRFNSDNFDDPTENIKKLFDNITNEDAVDLYRQLKTNFDL